MLWVSGVNQIRNTARCRCLNKQHHWAVRKETGHEIWLQLCTFFPASRLIGTDDGYHKSSDWEMIDPNFNLTSLYNCYSMSWMYWVYLFNSWETLACKVYSKMCTIEPFVSNLHLASSISSGANTASWRYILSERINRTCFASVCALYTS